MHLIRYYSCIRQVCDDSLNKSSAKHKNPLWIGSSRMAPDFVVMWAELSKRPFLSCCAHQLHMAVPLRDLDGSFFVFSAHILLFIWLRKHAISSFRSFCVCMFLLETWCWRLMVEAAGDLRQISTRKKRENGLEKNGNESSWLWRYRTTRHEYRSSGSEVVFFLRQVVQL
jgi:hypothetical protein